MPELRPQPVLRPVVLYILRECSGAYRHILKTICNVNYTSNATLPILKRVDLSYLIQSKSRISFISLLEQLVSVFLGYFCSLDVFGAASLILAQTISGYCGYAIN